MYIEPKDAIFYLLKTGDRSVLKKVDPSRIDELNEELRVTRVKLQMRQNQGQPLAKSRRQPSNGRRVMANPLGEGQIILTDADNWQEGQSYIEKFNIQVRHVPLKRD